MNEQQIIQTLTGKFNGSLWEKYGKRRIYFDGTDIAQRQGLDWSTYNSGNISSARLDGEKISNSEAKRILGEFRWFKIWYDLADGKFHIRGDGYKSEIQYPASLEMWEQFRTDALAAIRGGNDE